MAGQGENSCGGGSGAVRPGALSALLQEIAAAPACAGEAWDSGLRPGAVVGRFELVRELGRGGFGVVWEAKDRDLGRRVALKAVWAAGRRELHEERLLREAEAAAQLSHPNIVTLHDVGRTESGPYLVLELLEGKTLTERLSQGTVPAAEAVRLAVEVAKGLAHAHAHGVVHRDLKPENIFLCRDGQVKVLDFGLAHAFGHRRAEGGTPAYMAPEQARGAPEDERTDVWAVGAILFEMLSGQRPFENEKALRSSRPAPRLEVSGTPGLRELVAHTLAKDPLARPRDGGELMDALSGVERELERAPALAAGAVRTRRRPGLRLAAPIVAGLAAGGLVAGVAVWRGREHRPSAEQEPMAPPVPSIAVLPFADFSPGKDQEYFADGMSEEILNALTRVEGLRVIGRTSSFSFKGRKDDLRTIGRKLGASTVLEGSVRRDGPRIRVTARLLEADDGHRVWSETYERELGAVFAVQDEIAKAVVESLKVSLAPAGGTSLRSGRTANAAAHDQYLLGLHLARQGSRDGFRRAEEAFRRAIGNDPGYAPAQVGLASALVGRYNAGDSASAAETERMQKESLAATERAVRLAPDLADAWQARGMTRRRFLWDWPAAQADLERALALDPDHPEALWNHGWQAAMLGRPAEGIAALERATRVDPLSVEAWRWLGYVYLGAGERVRGRKALQHALEISPEHDWALMFLAMDLLAEGQAALALETTERSRTEVWRLWGRALAHHSLGNDDDSRRALEEVAQRWGHVGAYQIAELYAWRGERDRAFDWLERCWRDRDSGLTLAGFDPLVRGLRGDPRWADLRRRMKLPAD